MNTTYILLIWHAFCILRGRTLCVLSQEWRSLASSSVMVVMASRRSAHTHTHTPGSTEEVPAPPVTWSPLTAVQTPQRAREREKERGLERERGEPSGGLGQAGAPHSEGCILSSPLSILPHSVFLLLFLFSLSLPLFFSPGTSSPSLLIPQSAVQSWANHWGIWDLAQGGGCRDTRSLPHVCVNVCACVCWSGV